MKKLLLKLAPFAPDQSGAAAVLFELGGLTVIVDAGGCAGNIAGFDEPRFGRVISAVFSAGLRDMDAILGRDERLLANLRAALAGFRSASPTSRPAFAALIGTPVPALVATDFNALVRLAEKESGLPVLALPTIGASWYDAGASAAFLQLARRFTADPPAAAPTRPGVLGVWGATPLDLGRADAAPLKQALLAEGWRDVRCYGMGAGLDAIREAGAAQENRVIAPSGLAAAKYLEERFGTPWRAACPPSAPQEALVARAAALYEEGARRMLIVHQQTLAGSLRERVRRACPGAAVTAATWFMLSPDLAEATDAVISGEDHFAELAERGGFDVILADKTLRRVARGFTGTWLDLPHFAVSGRLEEEGAET